MLSATRKLLPGLDAIIALAGSGAALPLLLLVLVQRDLNLSAATGAVSGGSRSTQQCALLE